MHMWVWYKYSVFLSLAHSSKVAYSTHRVPFDLITNVIDLHNWCHAIFDSHPVSRSAWMYSFPSLYRLCQLKTRALDIGGFTFNSLSILKVCVGVLPSRIHADVHNCPAFWILSWRHILRTVYDTHPDDSNQNQTKMTVMMSIVWESVATASHDTHTSLRHNILGFVLEYKDF